MSAVKTRMKMSTGERVFGIVNAIIMITICLVIIYPIYYVVIASMTDIIVYRETLPQGL